ncbi:hypothetical protein HZA97_01875 [Candidatus Woesearchaeota archaeon]|nr:hypothetical protein [Candidatus Woesearchaeota archaeon]
MNDYFVVADDNFSGKRIEAIISAETPREAMKKVVRDYPPRDDQGNPCKPLWDSIYATTLAFVDVYQDELAFTRGEIPLDYSNWYKSTSAALRKEMQEQQATSAILREADQRRKMRVWPKEWDEF